jgi:hypothetical protein
VWQEIYSSCEDKQQYSSQLVGRAGGGYVLWLRWLGDKFRELLARGTANEVAGRCGFEFDMISQRSVIFVRLR